MTPASAPIAILVLGVSGSGKSTIAGLLAGRLGWQLADGDDFHPPANIAKMHAGTPLTDEDRWPWLGAIAAYVDGIRAAGEHTVVACSALRRAYRDKVTGGAGDVRLVYLKGDPDLVARRQAARHGHFMPASLLRSQFDTLEEPTADERPVVVSIDRPPSVMVGEIMAQLHLAHE